MAGVEIDDFAAEADGQGRGVEGADGVDAAAALTETPPEGGGVEADRGDDADPGQHGAAGGGHGAPPRGRRHTFTAAGGITSRRVLRRRSALLRPSAWTTGSKT